MWTNTLTIHTLSIFNPSSFSSGGSWSCISSIQVVSTFKLFNGGIIGRSGSANSFYSQVSDCFLSPLADIAIHMQATRIGVAYRSLAKM